jgi:hypothetical protein
MAVVEHCCLLGCECDRHFLDEHAAFIFRIEEQTEHRKKWSGYRRTRTRTVAVLHRADGGEEI